MTLRWFSVFLTIASTATALAACSSELVNQAAGSASGTGTSTAASASASSSSSSSSSSGQGGESCSAIVDAIAKQAGIQGSCTAVVRLDFTTHDLKAYELSCGPYAQVDEATARATATADTTFGGGQNLSGAGAQDDYVFFQPPNDFGGVGVVSARNGRSVFGGGIVWAGMGKITFPNDWRPVSELGPSCPSTTMPVKARGWNLQGGAPLDQPSIDDALAAVWKTALPDALWQNSYLFDGVVLFYAPSVGASDPASAEWIVLLNSGWLD